MNIWIDTIRRKTEIERMNVNIINGIAIIQHYETLIRDCNLKIKLREDEINIKNEKLIDEYKILDDKFELRKLDGDRFTVEMFEMKLMFERNAIKDLIGCVKKYEEKNKNAIMMFNDHYEKMRKNYEKFMLDKILSINCYKKIRIKHFEMFKKYDIDEIKLIECNNSDDNNKNHIIKPFCEYSLDKITEKMNHEEKVYIFPKLLLLICYKLHHFHSSGIRHRNIKPQHILLSFDIDANDITSNLINFSNHNNDPSTKEYEIYKEPEKESCNKSDIYSLGLTMIEFLHDKTIAYQCILNKNAINTSTIMYELLLKMIDKNVDERPSAIKIINFIKQCLF